MTAKDSVLRTLVLTAQYTDRLSYYDDWLAAFETSPQFAVTTVNICNADAAERVRTVMDDADLIVLLHATNGDTTIYLEPLATLLRDRNARLLSFVGNEVNLPGSPISAKRAVFGVIQPDFIATQLLQKSGEFLFGDLVRQAVLAIPHALNPDAFKPEKPPGERRWDIGVRAVRYLAHLGDDDRNRLHDFFATHSFAPDLRVDISDQRYDRRGWAAFLNDCRGTVSSEAGSWFIERDDATVEAIRAWTAKNMTRGRLVIRNDGALRTLGHKLPWRLRSVLRRVLSHGPLRHEATINEELTISEIHERFFAGRAIPETHGKCISSRHFDAIGTGTCQILLEGRYNDILKSGEHYIPLSHDFGNIDEVMDTFRDDRRRQEISERAREHVLAHHTYRHRTQAVYQAVTAA